MKKQIMRITVQYDIEVDALPISVVREQLEKAAVKRGWIRFGMQSAFGTRRCKCIKYTASRSRVSKLEIDD